MKRVIELVTEWSLDESVASELAKSMGLKSAGFGRYRNADGVITHITVNGKLTPVSKKDSPASGVTVPPEVKIIRKFKEMETKRSARNGKTYVDKSDAESVAVADAVSLWTHGNVMSVRNPSRWKEVGDRRIINDNYIIDYAGSPLKWRVEATRENYKKAHKTISILAKEPIKEESQMLFRGITLTPSEFESIKVGSTVDLGSMASFSKQFAIGDNFSYSNNKRVGVILLISPGAAKYGTDISDASHFNDEGEFVTSGRLEVTKVKEHPVNPDKYIVTVKHL